MEGYEVVAPPVLRGSAKEGFSDPGLREKHHGVPKSDDATSSTASSRSSDVEGGANHKNDERGTRDENEGSEDEDDVEWCMGDGSDDDDKISCVNCAQVMESSSSMHASFCTFVHMIDGSTHTQQRET